MSQLSVCHTGDELNGLFQVRVGRCPVILGKSPRTRVVDWCTQDHKARVRCPWDVADLGVCGGEGVCCRSPYLAFPGIECKAYFGQFGLYGGKSLADGLC